MKKQLINFLEAKDPEGKEWEVVLIQAGESENNRYYPAETLKKAVSEGLFKDAKCFAFEFAGSIFNHLPEAIRKIIPQGFVKNLVGVYDSIRYGEFKDENGNTQEGILAKLHVFESAKWLRKLLKEAWERGKRKLLELSIDAQGITNPKKIGNKILDWVEAIKDVNSVDVVSRGAAGGQFVHLLASSFTEDLKMNWKELLKIVGQHNSSLIEGIDENNILDTQALSLLKELIKIQETPEILKERLGFYTSMIDEVISLLEKNKNDDALKILEDLKAKLQKYGYAYPVTSKAFEYGYPYANNYGYPQEKGKYGYLYKKPEKVKEGGKMDLKEWQELVENLLKATKLSDEVKTKIREQFKEVSVKEKLEEAIKSEVEKLKEAEKDSISKVMEELKIMQQKLALKESEVILQKLLNESKLPQIVKDKVQSQFKEKVFKKEELEEAIKLETETLAKLTESGEIKGLGQGSVEITADQIDKFQVAMDKMLDPEAKVEDKFKNIPAFRGLKEAYRAINPEDDMISGQIDPNRQHKRLTEAITSADFSYILGTSMTRRAQKAYKIKPFIFDPIVSKVPVDNFKQQERVKWGGFGILPSVTEDAAYADLYEPKDEEATYTPATKGGYISVSRKTIKNDDLGYIRSIPKMVGRDSKWTLETDVANLLLTGTTAANYTPDVDALFSAAKANYSTNALSYANLTTAKNKISTQKIRGSQQDSGTATAGASTTITDSTKSWTTNAYANYWVRIVYGTGSGQTRVIASNTATALTISVAWTTNPDTTSKYEISGSQSDDQVLGLEAKYIIFGTEKRGVVQQLLTSEYDPDTASKLIANIHRNSLTPIWCPMVIGSTYQYYWFLACPKEDIDMIEVGFVDGQEEPLLVIQDQPYAGQVFTNDRIRWKVRYEYGLTAIDHKGLYGAFATS